MNLNRPAQRTKIRKSVQKMKIEIQVAKYRIVSNENIIKDNEIFS